ncbi:MAG: YdhR family protein [Dehalococcoidia bacterium]|nr:YdhR family protein [Dehalococcoidia bacterium]MCA9854750.1 YdhR family protein [Dehalococcoidia bacterium]
MHALLVLWDLSTDSKATFEELREYLWTRSMPRFREMEGLRQKTWISSSDTGEWGALYVFERRDQAEAVIGHLSDSPVVELTGKRPTARIFEVEAIVEGQHDGADLLTSGLVWAGRT